MAEVYVLKAIQYSCGCGFKTQVEKEALLHTQKTGHTLTVLGTVRPNK